MTLQLHQPNMVGCSAVSQSWINILFLVILCAISFPMLPINPITFASLSTARNYNTAQWSDATKPIVREAILAGRVQYARGDDNSLSKRITPHFDQLLDQRLDCALNPKGLLGWVVCRHNDAHLLKATPKLNASTGKYTSFTSSSCVRHPCFKDAEKKDDPNVLNAPKKHRLRNIIKQGAIEATVKDVRPFCLLEGDGMFGVIKSAIQVGVELGMFLHKISENLQKISENLLHRFDAQ